MKKHLLEFVKSMDDAPELDTIQVPNVLLDTEKIKMAMISEVPPPDRSDYFYSNKPTASFVESTLSLFNMSGVQVTSVDEIIKMGIYITTAVKTPKSEYTIKTDTIKAHLPILEEELNLFSNLKVSMLMGDVAKKAVNYIARKHTKKSVIPTESTYKIRRQEFYYKGIRVFPSYIMTGGNLLIEKSKVTMITEDIAKAIKLLEDCK